MKIWFWIDLLATLPFEIIITILGLNTGDKATL